VIIMAGKCIGKNTVSFISALFLTLVFSLFISGPVSAKSAGGTLLVSTSYKSLLSNEKGTGMLDRIVVEAFRRIGVDAEIVFSATGMSLSDVNAGLADAELNRVEGMEKSFPNLVMVPEPNMVMDFVAFSRKRYEIKDWESLRGLGIGIVKGWKILESNTEGFPYVVPVPSETELFNMLDMGRIDVALYDRLTGLEQISLRNFKGMFYLEPPLASRNMYLYLNRKHAKLAEPLAEALRSMKKDGTYDGIVNDATSHLMK